MVCAGGTAVITNVFPHTTRSKATTLTRGVVPSANILRLHPDVVFLLLLLLLLTVLRPMTHLTTTITGGVGVPLIFGVSPLGIGGVMAQGT